MHFGNQLRATVSADHHARHRFAQARAQPGHQLGTGFALVEVVVDQRQLRVHIFAQQVLALQTIARCPHLAAPA